jgi:hypothetical protein
VQPSPLAPRQRLVCDPLDERLEKPVLAALRRTRVGVDGEELLANERFQHRRKGFLVCLAKPCHAACGERLPQHGGMLDRLPLIGVEAVETCGDERMQCLGDVDRFDGPCHP